MTDTVNQSHVNTFSSNIFNLLEQRTSRTKGIFQEEFKTGEKHFFDRLGGFTATEITTKLQPTVLQDADHSRRMATVKAFEASVAFDRQLDKIKLLIDPLSDYAMKLAQAHGRAYDLEVLPAIFGDAQSNKTGSTAVPLPAAQKIAHGGTGLTTAKLNTALKKFTASFIDVTTTDVFLIVGAEGDEDLFGEGSQITSVDFQTGKALASGILPSYRGVNIVSSQLIPDIAANEARALLVTSTAVKVAVSKELKMVSGDRLDLNSAFQISSYSAVGAVRMEEEQVVEIAYQY